MNEKESKFLELLSTGCINNDFEETFNVSKAQDLVKNLSDVLNNISFKVNELVKRINEDCIAKAYFAEAAEYWIAYLYNSYLTGDYDERNKLSVDIGKIIYELDTLDNHSHYLSQIKNPKVLYEYNYLPSYITYKMMKEHRTLQQVYSKMVFYFLINYSRPSLKEDIESLISKGILDSNFWRLPLI